MNTSKERSIRRIDQLLKKSESIITVEEHPDIVDVPLTNADFSSVFFEWKTGAESLIVKVDGENSPYYRNFVERVREECSDRYELGMGILRALKEEIELDLAATHLILAGESDVVEFKSTLSYDISAKKTNKKLEHAVAKTIAAFINSEGGDLFIGIDDDKNVLGLSYDIKTLKKKNIDGFELKLVGVIIKYIGSAYASLFKITFPVYDGKKVCRVRVEKSVEPVFMRSEGRQDFFVRLGCSSQPLSGEEQSSYEKMHWSDEK